MGAVAFTGACVAIAVRIVRAKPNNGLVREMQALSLREIERGLSDIRDRLQQVATREDLAIAAKENRHAMGDQLQKVMTVMIEVQLELARLTGGK